jgi:hypothetical protein
MRAELEALLADLTMLHIAVSWLGFLIEQENRPVRPCRYALAA